MRSYKLPLNKYNNLYARDNRNMLIHTDFSEKSSDLTRFVLKFPQIYLKLDKLYLKYYNNKNGHEYYQYEY